MRTTSMALFFFAALVPSARAQAGDSCGCDSVLVDGVFQNRVLKGDHEAEQDIAHFVAHTTYDRFKKIENDGGGLAFLGFGFSARMSKEQYDDHMRRFVSARHSIGTAKTSSQLLERYGDEAVLKAWLDCKTRCMPCPGVRSTLELKDKNDLVLTVRYNGDASDSELPTVEHSSVTGAYSEVDGVQKATVLERGSKITRTFTKVLLHRNDATKPVLVSIHLEHGNDVVEYIPGWVNPPFPPPAIRIVKTAADSGPLGYARNDDGLYPGLVVHDRDFAPNTTPDAANWSVDVPTAGRYTLYTEYASDDSRPTNVYVNIGRETIPQLKGRLEHNTGGMQLADVQRFAEGSLDLPKGPIRLTFRREGNIPHIKGIELILETR